MKAMDYYRRASYEKGYASIYDQLGKNYETENATTSIHYYEKSLEISKKIGDKAGVCDVLSDIARFYNMMKNFRKAIEYCNEELQLSTEIQYLESQRHTFKNLSIAYEGLNDNKGALRNYKLYELISDSIFNVEKQKQATYLEVFLETERKQNEIVLLNKDNRLQDAEIKRQKAQKNGLMIAILLIFLLAFVLLRNYFRIRKTLALIKQQKKELEQNSDELSKQASLIQFQKDELEKSNNILSNQRYELQAKNDELNSQNEELHATMEELRNAQAQLVESEKMASLGVLSAGIAHEINNPVNFISSGIEGLKAVVNEFWSHYPENRNKTNTTVTEQGLQIENELDEALEILRKDYSIIMSNIDEGIERTVNVIKSLLLFTRAEQNVLKLVHNIHENLDSTLVLLTNQYKNRIDIVKNYGAIPPLYCYPGKLNQIFMNILSNAIQAIADSGTITIETSVTSDPGKVIVKSKREGSPDGEFTRYILISIKDTGEGIPESIRDKIFQPFFTTKDAGKGTGLGLSISYSLVREHRGIIQYTSKVNEGTCFMIFLPISNE
jgi:signal transduction histidine kinase